MRTIMRPPLICTCLILFCFSVAGAQTPERVISNFDDVKPGSFEFKDEIGSTFKTDVFSSEEGRGRFLTIKSKIVRNGWAGWGLALEGIDAGGFGFLSFYVRGQNGGETFEIGIKDKAGVEVKVQSSAYFDVSKEWQKISLPLTTFAGVELSSVDNINIGFNDSHKSGTIYLDDIILEGRHVPKWLETKEMVEMPEEVSRANKVVVDGFERINPYDFYRIREGDDSSLTLESTRESHDGDYGMAMQYSLSTGKSWGTWVVARWLAEITPLDWRGVREIKFRIKGDGSDNVVAFNIIDGSDEVWTCESLDILSHTNWQIVSIPLEAFALADYSRHVDGKIDLDKIKGYEIMLRSMDEKTRTGRIIVDQLYIIGEGLNPVWAAPPKVVERLAIEIPRVGNVDFGGTLYTQSFWCPELGPTVSHWGKLLASARVGPISSRIEFASQGQNFGEAAYITTQPDGKTIVTCESPSMIVPTIEVMLNQPARWLSKLSVGNICVNYTKYTFPATWGWKGAIMEGDVGDVNWHAFGIKQRYTSYTAGGRLKTYLGRWRVTGIGVYSQECAPADSSSMDTGVLSGGNEIDIRKGVTDAAGTFEIEQRLFQNRLSAKGTYGYNYYQKLGEIDYTEPTTPVYSYDLDDEIVLNDPMWRVSLESTDLFWQGLRTWAEYRDVGTEFKPKYREGAAWFDDAESDQKGYNLSVSQWLKGWTISTTYDWLNRNSNSDYFRRRTNWGIGYYGFGGLDVAFHQEYKREKYAYVSQRSEFSLTGDGRDEDIRTDELYTRLQLTPPLALWFKTRRESILHPATDARYLSESLFVKVEYYLASTAKVFAEYKTTRFGDPKWEPHDEPYDDNYVKAWFEFTF